MDEMIKGNVKDCVLETLENHKGEYISGTELAKSLQVSRNAVWKAIKALESEGYTIDAMKNKGYRLAQTNDIISEQSIQKYLRDSEKEFQLEVHKSVTSTNDILKKRAYDGEKEGYVVIAEEQTKGKGQLGRSFYSPMGTGIYMSMLLRPKTNFSEALNITTSAAVAVAQAIEEVSDKIAEIKWVNDIYCSGKKVCGILTEAGCNVETNGFDYVVLGIGINVKKPEGGFPEDIKEIADALFEDADVDVRSQLIAEILKRFWHFYCNLSQKEFFEEYRSRSCVIGRKVILENGDKTEEATVLSINEDCHLMVLMEDGTSREICAGTVRLKIK